MPILPLPNDVRAQVKSAVEITSLTDVVEELFKNSLDADASNVHITISFGKGFCTLRDDGAGIPSSEFTTSGNLARLHHTSKFESICYGSTGRFLASLSALSLLSISSRHCSESTASTVVLQQSEVIARQLGERNEDLDLRGTKVTVHNLFGNLPVRFKQQATRGSNPGELEKQFDNLRRLLVSYLLAFPKPVNLRLSETDSKLTYNHCTLQDATSQSFLLRQITSTLLQAGLSTNLDTWKLASARAGDLSIRAAICLSPSPSRKSQFVSFGKYPIPAWGVGALIYDTINSMFDLSAFGARAKMAKGVDRWPAFYVRVDTKSEALLSSLPAHHDYGENLPSTLHDIRALLKLLFEQFLRTHQFRPRHLRSRLLDFQRRPGTTRHALYEGYFDGWRRMKSAIPIPNDELVGNVPVETDQASKNQSSTLDEDIRLLLDDIELDSDNIDNSASADDVNRPQPTRNSEINKNDTSEHETVAWTNPRTGKVIHLNVANGCVCTPRSLDELDSNATSDLQRSSAVRPARRLPKTISTSKETARKLSNWPLSTKPSKLEQPVPSAVLDDSPQDYGTAVEQQIEAISLSSAQVLRQVDGKFILALIRPPANDVNPNPLILIDQHAADERIKVEEFYQQICSAKSVFLARPIVFEINDEEAGRFGQAKSYFSSWAIEYHIDPQGSPSTERQSTLSVTHLPNLIAERCRLEPRILIDTLRKEIWSDRLHRQRARTLGETWLSRISHCPQGLLDMINSRACRSAIMFNDILTNAQCKELLRQLSKCASPFQCAHGRPSLTVLTAFGNEPAFGSRAQESETFGKAFQRWCR